MSQITIVALSKCKCVSDVTVAEQSLEQVAEEIERAHVICIVFSVDRQETLNKIASYWLPFVRDNCSEDCRKPIILVGNKIDLIDYSVIDVSLNYNYFYYFYLMHKKFSDLATIC